MEEYWKDLSDTVEASNLGRVRSKFMVIKGEELGDGLELVMPKYIKPPKESARSFVVISGKASVKDMQSYLRKYSEVFLKMKKKQFPYTIDPEKGVCIGNIEIRDKQRYWSKEKGDNPMSYLELQRNVKAFRKDLATGLISL